MALGADGKGKSFNGHKVWAEVSASDPTSFSLYSGQSKRLFPQSENQFSVLKRILKQTDLTAKHSDPRSPHENGLGEPLIKIPLMLATVKEERDAAIRFCFRIISKIVILSRFAVLSVSLTKKYHYFSAAGVAAAASAEPGGHE